MLSVVVRHRGAASNCADQLTSGLAPLGECRYNPPAMLPAACTLSRLVDARPPLRRWMCVFALAICCVGCGTTRTTDSGRTATEQLLISDAIDRAVDSLDLKILAGQKVFVDNSMLGGVTDRDYLISSVRQQLLASGVVLKTVRDEADFIVEVRAGAVGTDRNDLLFGVPAFQVPQVLPFAGSVPSAIPEIPFAKRSQQRGVAKIALFAYEQSTGEPVWQSGLAMQQSTSSDIWIFGTGPFQKGTIHDGTKLAGSELTNPLVHNDDEDTKPVAIATPAVFQWPDLPRSEVAEADDPASDEAQVEQAGHEE